jgi:ubiquinone/menaquinone biosynthesis C-methylase UbiE
MSIDRHAGDDDDPSVLLALGLGFWQAKVLLTAMELGVFAELHRSEQSADALATALGLAGRGSMDFFDALVSLGLLERSGGVYRNSRRAARFLVPGEKEYMGGALEMANARLYPVWAKLTEALRSGRPQNEAKEESDYYSNLNRDRERLRTFMSAMTGLSLASSQAIARQFPWAKYRTFIDVGGAQGGLAVAVATAHPHLTGGTFELPAIEQFFDEYVSSFQLGDRLRFHSGDFFRDPLPPADVYVMGHVLHNWDLEHKRTLIRKVYDALPPGGALVVYESLIDDAREKNTLGFLMSLNMLLVTGGGFVFTGADCTEWMRETGFHETSVEHLHGADWMVVGVK